MNIIAQDDVREDIPESEMMAVGRGNGVSDGLGMGGDTAGFRAEYVGTRVEQDGVRGLLKPGANCELVRLMRRG